MVGLSLEALSVEMVAVEVLAGILAANARIENQTFLSWVGDGAYEHILSVSVAERLLWLFRSLDPLTAIVPEYPLKDADLALASTEKASKRRGRFDLAVLTHRPNSANGGVDAKSGVPICLFELKREWFDAHHADKDLARLAEYVQIYGSSEKSTSSLRFCGYGFFVYRDATKINEAFVKIEQYARDHYSEVFRGAFFSPPAKPQSINVDKNLVASAGVLMFAKDQII